VAIDFEAEGLLKGTRGEARKARLKLLEELAEDGVSLDELKHAVEEDRLALLPVEQVLAGAGRRYTAAEVAETVGLEEGFLLRQRQALGLPAPDPDDPVFTDSDVEAARRAKAFREAGLPEDGLLEVSRVLGMAMSQVAAANRALIGEAMLRGGGHELEVAHRFADTAQQLGPMLGDLIVYILNLHLLEQIRNDAIGRTEIKERRFPGAQEVTACFADLVGFTRLGEELPPEELGAVTGRLSEMVGDVINAPVRVVKMIGDAAMLVAPDTDAVLSAALELVEAAENEGEGFPMLHAGVARGPALARAGDWYGRPVNMASRITTIAYASSVLVEEEAREAASGQFRWSDAGRKRLKGIDGAVQLYRVRAADDEGPGSNDRAS
jgi:adenylate cyclase